MTIYVCVGSACHLKGAYNIINCLQSIIEEKQLGEEITVKAALCLGRCTGAVSVKIDEEEVISVSDKNVKEVFQGIIKERLGK